MSESLRQLTYPLGQQFQLLQGDLTAQPVDAIVNAANARLMHGGGVAALIARRGGRIINDESRRWVREHGPVRHAEPAYTSGGDLPARYVIHAVGPVWGAGDEDEKLSAAIIGSLRRAEQLELASIAFPAISTGIFGFPKALAARVIFEAVADYCLAQSVSCIQQIYLVLYDQSTVDAFLNVWDEIAHARR